jgi:LuxR family maltose regulon positive regulatory protein
VYLYEEVLSKLDDELLTFVLVTAQVEFFSSSLAADLLQQDRLYANKKIKYLVDTSLFIEDLGKRGLENWYQYQPLFALALRRLVKVTPELQLTTIFARASEWFEINKNINQAASCALQAQNFNRILSLIETYWLTLLMEDRGFLLYQWAKELPEEVIRANPLVCSVISISALLEDDVELAMLCDTYAMRHYVSPEQPHFAFAHTLHAQICNLQKRYQEAHEAAQTALRYLDEDDYYFRVSAHQADSFALEVPAWAAYRDILLAYLEPALKDGNKSYLSSHYAFLSSAEGHLGNFSAALGYAKKFYALLGKDAYPYRAIDMNVYYAQMNAAYHRGTIAEAQLYQHKHKQTANHLFASRDLSLSQALEAVLYYLSGEHEKAQELAAASLKQSPYGFLSVLLPLGFIDYLQDHEVIALDVFLMQTSEAYESSYIWKRLYYIDCFLHDDTSVVEKLRADIEEIEESSLLDNVFGQLLLALLEEKAQNPGEAEIELSRALELAESEGIIQLFCNEFSYVMPILERIIHQSDKAPNKFVQKLSLTLTHIASGEVGLTGAAEMISLTPREKDVVFLLVSGLSPQEIATRLSISRETARKHIANVYSKYDVHSRTQLFLRLQ